MRFFKAVQAACCIALLSAMFSPSMKADDYDKKTTVTFTMPVQIPGVHLTGWGVLPPGTYVFKLMNSSSNRHIVQIFNQDQTKIYATILAIPNYRLTPTEKTVITFNEGLRDEPESIRAWFYPGANWGEEFVYPKAKAAELAKVAKVPVLAAAKEFKAEVETPEEPAVIAELTRVPVVAIRPTGKSVELAQVIQSTPTRIAQPVSATSAPTPSVEGESSADAKLPDTASNLPLIALCGVLALCAALSIGFLRKRTL